MRSVKTSIIIVSLLVIGAIGYNLILGHTAKRMTGQIEEIQQSADSDDWDKTNQSLQEFSKKFKETGKWLSTLVNHHDVDGISTSLERLIQFGKYNEKTEFMAELSNLKLLIDHIPAKERLTLANFL